MVVSSDILVIFKVRLFNNFLNSFQSVYQKFKLINEQHIGRIQLKNLKPGIAYKILAIQDKEHAIYGVRQHFLITTPNGLKYDIRMPRKYICNMLPHNLRTVQHDIDHDYHPYIVYCRYKLSTKVFYFNIIRKSMFYYSLSCITYFTQLDLMWFVSYRFNQ